jgi:hypothetical protein
MQMLDSTPENNWPASERRPMRAQAKFDEYKRRNLVPRKAHLR